MLLAFELIASLLKKAVMYPQHMPDYPAIGNIYETSTRNAKTCVTYIMNSDHNSMSSDHIIPSDMSLVS
ncbi:hypothetical protein F383_23130 [Gossypium arboreum]|uniref:Uncharacterized protein n=1 Tax=Gossypium arboreum TaxID=29729 RepID=A0A0B0NWZ2_GOSAR|nr:hypothetical protein F383_23130 [Gossypium arboreum]